MNAVFKIEVEKVEHVGGLVLVTAKCWYTDGPHSDYTSTTLPISLAAAEHFWVGRKYTLHIREGWPE